jgi:arylsulfatase A-like enzyme
MILPRFALLFILFAASACGDNPVNNIKISSENTADSKPNIVLIVADDQGFADYGKTLADIKTPSIDNLVKQGVVFKQAYATSPICNASRMGLITSQYQQKQGTFWYGGVGMVDESIPTIAEILKTNGYTNGYVGKFHYGKTKLKNSDRRDFPLNHGFDYFYGFEGGRKHYLNHKEALEAAFLKSKKEHQQPGQSLAQGPMWLNKTLVDQDGFSTELFGDQALEFIKGNKDKPFFLQLAFNAVHNFTHQIPAEELKRRGLKGYRDWDPAKEDYRSWYVGSRYPNNDEGRQQYLVQLEHLDTEVGKIIQYLDDSDLRKNTIVIYISDNGGSTPIYANNGHLRGSKYTLYEGGIRIPMIISWPEKIIGNKVREDIVSTMDILPTLCEYITSCTITTTDGVSIKAALNGAKTIKRDYLVWDTNHEIAVRQGDWKLKIAKESAQRHADSEMVNIDIGTFLYNLKDDPSESKDLSQSNPAKLNELLALHQQWRVDIDKKQKL